MVNSSNPFDNLLFRLLITDYEINSYGQKGKDNAIMFSVIQKLKYKYGVLEKRKIELFEKMCSGWDWKILPFEKDWNEILEGKINEVAEIRRENVEYWEERLKKSEDTLDKLEQTSPFCER